MKLLYCKMDAGNFGDDLNEWFWDRVAPGLIDGKGPDTLFGIGTLLQNYYARDLPHHGRVFVLGTGAGSKGPLPEVNDRWTFLGVRGPLTASYFGLGPEMVCGDPAILVSRFEELKDPAPGRAGVGFMPHVWSLADWDWKATCERLGLVYVDPTANSKATIRLISRLERLITEAMHGAIVADALRVPWVAIHLSDKFESSKWCDWAGSLGIDLHFRQIRQLRRRPQNMKRKIRNVAKEVALRVGVTLKGVDLPNSSATEIAYTESQIRYWKTSDEVQLSCEVRLNQLMGKLEEKIDIFGNSFVKR